jgi:short subunit dehydrogenase-like uncharacterized protein
VITFAGTLWIAAILFVIGVAAIALALKAFEAGRLHERRIVSENFAEIVRRAVDKVLGAPNENWSQPMRDQLRKKMWDEITATKDTTRH